MSESRTDQRIIVVLAIIVLIVSGSNLYSTTSVLNQLKTRTDMISTALTELSETIERLSDSVDEVSEKVGVAISQPTPEPTKQEVTFTIARSQRVETLDTARFESTHQCVTSAFYENLLHTVPGTTDVENWLATSYELSPDGLTYRFQLREDVLFHDSTKFNATAVKVSFERAIAAGYFPATRLRNVDRVEIIDTYTVDIHLKNPEISFLAIVASGVISMVSPTAVAKHEVDGDFAMEWFHNHEAGTGPYVLIDYKLEEYSIMEKFDDYWRGWEGPHVDRIVGMLVKESTTRRLMIMNAEVDFAEDLLPTDAGEMEGRPGIKVVWAPSLAECYLHLNMYGVLENKALREMLAYVFDYDAAIEGIWLGHAEQSQGPIPKGMFGHNFDLPMYSRDLDMARAKLAEAGYEPGELTLSVLYNIGYEWKRMTAELLSSNLAEIGVDLEINVVTWPMMWDACTDPTAPYDIYIWFKDADVGDPHPFFTSMYHTIAIGPGGVNKGYNNTLLIQLMDQAPLSKNREEYEDILKQIQEIVNDDLPQVFLYDLQFPRAHRDWVKGYKPNLVSSFSYEFYDIYIEGRP